MKLDQHRKLSWNDEKDLLEGLQNGLHSGEASLASFFDRRRVLVTGGTGFFGKWMTQALCLLKDHAGSQHHLILWTRDVKATLRACPWLVERSEISWFEGDIREKFPNSIPFDSVVHGATAASAALNEGNPVEMFDVIVEGTKNVLAACRERKVKDILFISSGGIYGKQPLEMTHIPESYTGAHPTFLAGSAYGIGKTSAEFLSSCYAREMNARVLLARCFAFVGPYLPLDTHFAVGNFMRDVLEKKDIQIGGDGTPYRSFLFGSDLVLWLFRILQAGQSLQPYHIGSEEGFSIEEIARKVAAIGEDVTGHRAEVRIAKKPTPGIAPPRFVPSTLNTRESLGLKVRVNFEEGVRRTLLWHLGKQ